MLKFESEMLPLKSRKCSWSVPYTSLPCIIYELLLQTEWKIFLNYFFLFFLVQSFHWWIIWYLWCLLPTFSKQIRTQLFLVLNSEQSHCDVTHWSLKLPLLSVPDFTFPPWNSCPIPKLRKRWSMGGAERSLIKPGECKTAVFAK